MRSVLGWKLTLCRLRGFPFRLHFSFLLFVPYILYACSQAGQADIFWHVAAALGMLFVGVLLHEFAHAWTAAKVGAEVSEILIWPLGGLSQHGSPHWIHDDHTVSQQELLISSAGPAVNFTLALSMVPLVMALGLSWTELFNPVQPPFYRDWLQFMVATTFWINWLLFAVNLLPAYPLDGGRMLQAVIWKRFGYQVASLWTAQVARVVAFVLLVVGLVISPHLPVPAVLILLLGVLIFASARSEVQEHHEHEEGETFLGYDFSQGYTSLEKEVREKEPQTTQPGPIQRWLDNRKAAKAEQQRRIEAEEEARFDEILARIHEQGWDTLTAEEKEFARRVSERYRNRD